MAEKKPVENHFVQMQAILDVITSRAIELLDIAVREFIVFDDQGKPTGFNRGALVLIAPGYRKLQEAYKRYNNPKSTKHVNDVLQGLLKLGWCVTFMKASDICKIRYGGSVPRMIAKKFGKIVLNAKLEANQLPILLQYCKKWVDGTDVKNAVTAEVTEILVAARTKPTQLPTITTTTPPPPESKEEPVVSEIAETTSSSPPPPPPPPATTE